MRTANRAAGMILGDDIEARVGARLDELGAARHADAGAAVRRRLPRSGSPPAQAEWREQFVFQAPARAAAS